MTGSQGMSTRRYHRPLTLTSFNPPSPKLENIKAECHLVYLMGNTLCCNECLFHYSSILCAVDYIRLLAKSRTEDKSVMISKYQIQTWRSLCVPVFWWNVLCNLRFSTLNLQYVSIFPLQQSSAEIQESLPMALERAVALSTSQRCHSAAAPHISLWAAQHASARLMAPGAVSSLAA